MERTLAHFPTLAVVVERVEAAEAVARPESRPAGDALVHARGEDPSRTLCGLETDGLTWTDRDLFVTLNPIACRDCVQRA